MQNLKAVVVRDSSISVIVRMDGYEIMSDVPSLGLKKGEDFSEFYKKYKKSYIFTKADYFNKDRDWTDIMLKKNPVLGSLIKTFDLHGYSDTISTRE